jgi:hypothetical protein
MSTEEREDQPAGASGSPLNEEGARNEAHARAWELAKRQGVVPIKNMDELRGDFWPEDESIDDFLAWVRELRQSDKPRSLPE